MTTQVLYPKFKAFTAEGLPAAGYRLYTYEAGTTTPTTTYSDYLLTTPNTNPVVLDEAGEAVIYTRRPLKLVLKTPAGVTVMTQDWVAVELGTPPLLASTVSGTQHNRYKATVTPEPSSVTNGQQVTFTPDVDNTDTLVSRNFSGSGINDLQWQGPYSGTTSGSTFTVQIDGAKFQGTGKNDLSWGGTPVSGFTYTVKIAATGTPDKFVWKKGSGNWSSQINITGGWQDLTDGVKIKFGSTTGHTVNDLWNIVDSFKWRKDSGSWTEGVAVTGEWQSLIEGVKVKFSTKTGHTLNDAWSVTVELPVTFSLNNLGYWLVYKNVGGNIQPLDGEDFKAGMPTTLMYSSGLSGWVLVTPQVPVWEPEQVQRLLDRVEVLGDYSLSRNEHGREIACYNTDSITLYLPQCATAAGVFYDIKVCGTGNVTIAAYGSEKIYTPYSTTGTSSFNFQSYGPPQSSLRIASNGVDWHILAYVTCNPGVATFTSSGTWTNPGFTKVQVFVCGGGGGGAGGTTYGGSGGGGGGGFGWGLFDVTGVASVSVTVGAAGQGGAIGSNGTNGGSSSFGSYITATGGGGGNTNGNGGSGGTCTGGTLNVTGEVGGPRVDTVNGGYGGSNWTFPFYGIGGQGGLQAGPVAPTAGTGFGGGGGGGYGGTTRSAGANGSPGLVVVVGAG